MSRSNPSLTSAARVREYGQSGLFGVLTPQVNPTVEPELHILLPPRRSVLIARLMSRQAGLRERLEEYDARLDEFLDSFNPIVLNAIGIACTGMSYRLDAEVEASRLHALAARKGYPVITAAEAIRLALESLGVQRLALISPYPTWLTQQCLTYWQRRGFQVAATLQLPSDWGPDHRIYEISSRAVIAALAGFDAGEAQALLVAGTGIPSLRVILEVERARQMPVLSSNLCLAWALVATSTEPKAGPESRLYGGWATRLASA